MMKLKELLMESADTVIGPFKVKAYDETTRVMQLDGHDDVVLDASIKDKPTVGYNQSFQLKDGSTASKLINQTSDLVIHTTDKVLLIKRKKAPFAGSWAIPGGFIDPGEKPIDAAKRELKEETGVDVSGSLKFVGLYKEGGRDPRSEHAWSYAYAIKVDDELAADAGDDASSVSWMPIEDALKLRLAFDHSDILKKAL